MKNVYFVIIVSIEAVKHNFFRRSFIKDVHFFNWKARVVLYELSCGNVSSRKLRRTVFVKWKMRL